MVAMPGYVTARRIDVRVRRIDGRFPLFVARCDELDLVVKGSSREWILDSTRGALEAMLGDDFGDALITLDFGPPNGVFIIQPRRPHLATKMNP